MKFLLAILLASAILLLSNCSCPPKNPDGTKSGPCKYGGPNIQGTIGYNGVSVGLTLFGEPSLPTIVIPVNKHDPEPIYPTK